MASSRKPWSARQISITGQIQLVLVGLVVLSLLGTARWLISYSNRLQEAQLRQIQQMQGEMVAQATVAYLNQHAQSLASIIEYADLFSQTHGGQQQILAQLGRGEAAYHALAIINERGEVVTAVAVPPHTLPEGWARPTHWFPLLQHTAPVWGEVKYEGGTHGVDLLIPGRALSTSAQGLVVRLGLDFLPEAIAQASQGVAGYSYMVDEHGHVLASSLPIPHLTPAAPQVEPAVYRGWQGQDVLGVQSRVQPTGWRVVVEVPTAVAYQPLQEVTFGMGLALSVATVTAALIGAFLARQLLIPLQSFTEVATRISQGDLHSRVTLHTQNEFGLLARAFNSMADQTQSLIRHMEQRVDELHETYLALQESQMRFRIIAEASPVALVMTHRETGRLLYGNYQAGVLLGVSQAELVQRNILDFYKYPQQRIPLLAELAQHGQLHNYELTFVRSDKREIWVSLVVTPIQFEGEAALFTAVQDVSEQKQAAEALKAYSARLQEMVEARTHELRQSNQQLVEAKNAAEAANQSKTVFLANVSHELRTPLNAILGFTQLLQRSEEIVPEDQEYLDIIYQSGRHLLNLINDVLEMSKIEAGQMVVNKSQVDLHQLLNSLRSMFTNRAESKGLALLVQYAENVPQYVLSDERKLTQILINLLNNGLKFTHMGYVALNVTSQPDGEEAVRVRFEVRDTGVGIATQEQALLFRPFTQTSSGQQAQEGTGLGLALSQQLVRLLGGEMTLESKVGQGSVFAFTLRVERAAPPETPSQPLEAHPQVVGLAVGQPSYRILVVEDRRENRMLLTALLGAVGFEVQTAADGREGLETALVWEPHLVLMDIRMPVMDGYEATQQLKQLLEPCPPIVAISAGAFDSERSRALAAGCDDFIPKPFDEEELWRVLHTHLGVQFAYASAPTAEKTAVPVPLSAAHLQELDEQWRTALYQAAITADQQKMLQLIGLIQHDYPQTAEHLTLLVRQFATREVLALLGVGNW